MNGDFDDALVLLNNCVEERSHGSVSLDDFPPSEVRHLVDTRGVPRACDKIMECAESLMELQELERKADLGKLKDMFLEGRFEVRGRDVDNRPVVWLQAPQHALALKKPYAEFLVYFFWIFSWGVRCRTSENSGIFVVADDSIRSLLDFNLSALMATVDLNRRFELRTHPDSRVRFIIKSKIAKTLADLVWNGLGWSDNSRMQIVYEKKEVLQQLADPTNYPAWFLPGGRTYEPAFDSIGEWSYLPCDEVGFKNLCLRDLWRPDPNSIDILRLTAEQLSDQGLPLMRRIPAEISVGLESVMSVAHSPRRLRSSNDCWQSRNLDTIPEDDE